MEEKRIKTVILWQNGMVMVFGEDGQQMPEYQGTVEEVKAKIDSVYQGQWEGGNWQQGRIWKIATREDLDRRIIEMIHHLPAPDFPSGLPPRLEQIMQEEKQQG